MARARGRGGRSSRDRATQLADGLGKGGSRLFLAARTHVASVAPVFFVKQGIGVRTEMDAVPRQDRALAVGSGIVFRHVGSASCRDGDEDRCSNPALMQRVDKRIE